MSNKELDKLHIIKRLVAGDLSPSGAGHLLDLSTRQIGRLKRRFLNKGPAGLISGKRGQISNNKLKEEFKEKALSIIKQDYHDYGPTLAAEKLYEYNGLKVSKETVRQWMIEAGLRKNRPLKEQRVHQPRYRRPFFGELIQIDGSIHDWFEGRGPKCTLLVFIDDATSLLQKLLFVPAETTHSYLRVLKDYLRTYGKPRAIYSDKHGVFSVNIKEAKSGNGLTQFGRVLHSLNIEAIFAHSPQAKGRVERANGTLQDRLVKELRYHHISTIEAANAILDTFRQDYNKRFGKPPREMLNVHTLLTKEEEINLDKLCTFQERHRVSKNLTFKHKRVLYKLKIPGKGNRIRQEGVLVCEDESGKITVLYNNQVLEYEVYAEHYRDSQPITRKGLESLLDQLPVKEYLRYLTAQIPRSSL